jgi:predicted PurR-regulated permease PerM
MKDTENVEKGLVALLFFVMVLVMGLCYTVRNFRTLLQKMGDQNEKSVDHLAEQFRDSHKSLHQDLGEELKSIQQLQTDVATHLVELKSIVAQFSALQYQNNENDKQD